MTITTLVSKAVTHTTAINLMFITTSSARGLEYSLQVSKVDSSSGPVSDAMPARDVTDSRRRRDAALGVSSRDLVSVEPQAVGAWVEKPSFRGGPLGQNPESRAFAISVSEFRVPLRRPGMTR